MLLWACVWFFVVVVVVYFAIVNKHTNCILLCFVSDSATCGALSSSTDKMTFIRNLNMQMHNTYFRLNLGCIRRGATLLKIERYREKKKLYKFK